MCDLRLEHYEYFPSKKLQPHFYGWSFSLTYTTYPDIHERLFSYTQTQWSDGIE